MLWRSSWRSRVKVEKKLEYWISAAQDAISSFLNPCQGGDC
jgi:hypothetical protein